jgi:hypothetical protein
MITKRRCAILDRATILEKDNKIMTNMWSGWKIGKI